MAGLNDILAAHRASIGLEPADAPVEPSEATLRTVGDAGATPYGRRALLEEVERVRCAIDGERNHTLFRAAAALSELVNGGHLAPVEVREHLTAAAEHVGLDAGEITATLGSATKKTAGKGRGPDPDDEVAAFLHGGYVGAGEGDAPTDATTEPPKPTLHEQMVAKELAMLRARDEAKRAYASERAALDFRPPPSVLTLREQLLLPRAPVTYSIADLLPHGGNALATAAYKAGKTTLMTALVKAYADNTPFLGRFTVTPHAGRIAIWNYELSQSQYDQWLEESGIVNTDRISVLHARGFRLDLRAPSVEDWVVAWHKDHDTATWIADPLARASVGTDEDSNTEMGVWLDTFDVIKSRAGIIDGILPNHTGRMTHEEGAERGRGATRVDDWADARWILTRDKDGNRFFRATGRDVDVAEERLTYDEADRSLRFGGGDKRRVAEDALDEVVVQWVSAHPGANQTEVERGVEGKAVDVRSSLKRCVRLHRLRVDDGPRNALLFTANSC